MPHRKVGAWIQLDQGEGLLKDHGRTEKAYREVPDFPKPGINFYDITTLLKHPAGLRRRSTLLALNLKYENRNCDGVEARGFIFAPARRIPRAGFVPVAQAKKAAATRT